MFKRRFLGTILIGAVLVLSLAVPAMATSIEIPTSGQIDLTNAPLTNSMVTPFTVVDVGGGTWDYGTRLYGLTQKQVWSNYFHPTKQHHSSCSIGTRFSTSGVVPAKQTSFSSAVGGLREPTKAYWGVDE